MDHPLQHMWVLWEHKSVNNKSAEWGDSMRVVCEFSSIEQFWSFWRFMPRPSEVLDGKGELFFLGNKFLAAFWL